MNNKPKVACPECGGETTQLATKVTMEPGNLQCNEYSCAKCGIKFIPALESFTLMNKWQHKIRINGNNEGESWKKSKTIIIKEECVGGCCSSEPLLEEIGILFTQITGHKPDSSQYADFVNGVRNSKFLTQFFNKEDAK